MADGRITIDTTIDTKGISVGTKEVVQAFARMAKELNGLSEKILNVFVGDSGNLEKEAEAIGKINGKLEEASSKLAELDGETVDIKIERMDDIADTTDIETKPRVVALKGEYEDPSTSAAKFVQEWEKKEVESVKKARTTLLSFLSEAKGELKELANQGFGPGDAEYDSQAQKVAELNQQLSLYTKGIVEAAQKEIYGLDSIEGKIAEVNQKIAELSNMGFGIESSEMQEQLKLRAELLETEKNIYKEVTKTDAQRQAEAQKELARQSAIQARAEAVAQKEAQRQAKAEAVEARRVAAEEKKLRAQRAVEVQEAMEAQRLKEIADAAQISSNEIVKMSDELAQLSARQAELEKAGLGVGYEEYDQNIIRISKLKQAIDDYKKSLLPAKEAQNEFRQDLDKTSGSAEKLRDATNKTGMMGSVKTLLKYSLGIRSLYALVNKLRAALVEGFKNLAQYSDNTNATLSGLMSSLAQCKNALATAFDPILQIVAPALNYLINLVTAAATAVAQLIAILTGKGTFIKATKVQKDYAKALKGTGGAAKEAEGALASFDKLNVLPDQSAGGGGGGGAGAGIDDMFETVEVSDSLKGIGKILSDLFKPFKDAWERDGQSVIEAAKYALSSMGKLAKSVGKSFMEVWTNGTGTRVVSTLLQIARNILTVVGNIATRLNIAWNTNKVGTRIIQGIFDLFLSVLDTINRITASTEEWSRTLDFTPLLESVSRMLEALKPLTDTVGKGLEWLWNEILLPISKWTIEDAVPAFLDMLAGAVDSLNAILVAFEPAATWFWDNFLKPVGEWTGGVIISAMEKITELLERFATWITENKEPISQFAIIVGTVASAFIGAKGAITLAHGAVTLISAAIPILTGAFSTLIGVVTGPIGIVAAFAAMVIAAGNGEEMLKNLKEALKGLGELAAGVFSLDWERAWNGAKQAVTGAIDAIKLAIESAITLIDRLMGKADSLGEIEITENKNRRSTNLKTAKYGFKSTPRMAQGYSAQPVRLPRLASGTVVPPRAGEFAAILGDNRREAEVVSPLSTMEKAMGNVLQKYGGMGGDISLTVNLDGRVVYQNVVKRNRMEKDRTGLNPLIV